MQDAAAVASLRFGRSDAPRRRGPSGQARRSPTSTPSLPAAYMYNMYILLLGMHMNMNMNMNMNMTMR